MPHDHYTQEKPHEPGYYFVLATPYPPTIVEIRLIAGDQHGLRVYYFAAEELVNEDYNYLSELSPECWWAGPIDFPSRP